jgi:hypothetical protein
MGTFPSTHTKQVFDELSCSEVPVINPHIPVLVRFMLEVAANRQFDGLVRERAKNLVVVIIQVRVRTRVFLGVGLIVTAL